MDFSRTTPSDEIEDEPGNPWDESNTPVGSHFGESGDRIRSAKIRGKTSTLSRGNDPDKTCHDHTDEVSISSRYHASLCHAKVLCPTFLSLQFGFVIFWQNNISAKTTRKILMKLTIGYSKF